jgi:hypothetical protein
MVFDRVVQQGSADDVGVPQVIMADDPDGDPKQMDVMPMPA